MSENSAPLNRVLSIVGLEIWQLTESLSILETALQDSIAGGRTLDSTATSQLQSIDLITQTLTALSEFTLTLATLIPSHVEADITGAVKSIKLSDLAARLMDADLQSSTEQPHGNTFQIFE